MIIFTVVSRLVFLCIVTSLIMAQTSVQSNASPSNIIYEGYLHKKGRVNRSWKKRYFILTTDKKLKYCEQRTPSKNNNGKKQKKWKEIGHINLQLVTGISTHQWDNTDEIYELSNPNMRKNTRYYEEQDAFRALSPSLSKSKTVSRAGLRTPKHAHTHKSHSMQFVKAKSSNSLPHHNQSDSKQNSLAHEYIYRLYTPKRIWYLRCKDEASMNEWTTAIKRVVYGNIMYESHLLIEEESNSKMSLIASTPPSKIWRSRWCLLTDRHQLRVYEDQTQAKYRECLALQHLQKICYNDQFRYFNNRREYPLHLSRADKQFTIATLSHRSREIWMDKFSQLMKNTLYKMEVLKEGYVWMFEMLDTEESVSRHWDKKYIAVDSKNYLYLAHDLDAFRYFSKGIYFDLSVYEEEKQHEMDFCVQLFHGNKLFKYGKVVDEQTLQLFDGTAQSDNEHIFYITFAVYTSDAEQANHNESTFYFATTSHIELTSWLNHLKLLQKEYCKQHSIPFSKKRKPPKRRSSRSRHRTRQKKQQYQVPEPPPQLIVNSTPSPPPRSPVSSPSQQFPDNSSAHINGNNNNNDDILHLSKQNLHHANGSNANHVTTPIEYDDDDTEEELEEVEDNLDLGISHQYARGRVHEHHAHAQMKQLNSNTTIQANGEHTSIVEAMPFYAQSRISVAIAQSCLDMNTDNTLDISTAAGSFQFVVQKQAAWSTAWQQMNNLTEINRTFKGNMMDDQSGKECQSILTCPCFQRISFIMQFYDDWIFVKRKLKAASLRNNRTLSPRLVPQTPNSPITPSVDSYTIQTPHTNIIGIPNSPIYTTPPPPLFLSDDEHDDQKSSDNHDRNHNSNRDGIYDYLNRHFMEYSTLRLINDYHHIFAFHKYNDDDFEFIYSHLPTTSNANTHSQQYYQYQHRRQNSRQEYGSKCNVIMCDCIKRNERQRGADNVKQRHRMMSVDVKHDYFGYKDNRQVTCIQLLDRIHSVLYHSYDLFRLSPAEQRLIKKTSNNNNMSNGSIGNEQKEDVNGYKNSMSMSVDEDDHYARFLRCMSVDESFSAPSSSYIDHNFAAMHKIMKSKQTKLVQLRNYMHFNQADNKFVTALPDPEDMASNILFHARNDSDISLENIAEIQDHQHHKQSQSSGFPDVEQIARVSTFHFDLNEAGNGKRKKTDHQRSHSLNEMNKKKQGKDGGGGHNRLPTLDTTVGAINIGSLSNQQNMNQYGVKFTYWIEEENEDGAIYIQPKYANLKQEILSNKLCNISRTDWDQTFYFAQKLLHAHHVRDFAADLTESEVRKYKIKDGAGIVVYHMQSLLLYSNYGDTLHKALTSTYLEFDVENNFDIIRPREVIKRHSEYCNWAKYLSEFALIFGENITKSSSFYHGITCQYKFSDLQIYYNYPISVTTQSNIATHFVNKQGIILQLNRTELMSGPKTINCSFFSDKEYEEEVLLMFANQRPLKIVSIIELNTSYSYYYHLCAIYILDDIINGREVNRANLNNQLKLTRLNELLRYKFNTETYQIEQQLQEQQMDEMNGNSNHHHLTSIESPKLDIRSLSWLSPPSLFNGGNNLLQSKPPNASPRYSTFVHKMDYIHKLFIAYCNHQNNLIKLDVKLITCNEELNEKIAPFFVATQYAENGQQQINCLKMDSLIKLFPNVKAFEIKCAVLHSYTFDSMLRLLDDRLIDNMDSQIHHITFKWVNFIQQQHFNLDEILVKYKQKFKERAWTLEKKHKYGFDYLTIQKDD